jgi:2-polyprenyl-6-hydroxyphenyl methylase/3-demethylubiquinone-9 3-methyltransferase
MTVTETRETEDHAAEVASGDRFEFGKNWSRFLSTLNPERIATAEASLRDMLDVDTLEGKSFLDIGCGSGLFSLAAYQLGARVFSFDFDPNSVACALELKRRYAQDPSRWTVEEGSALDAEYVASHGQFDIVYSWGVLHHTGDMWTGLTNVIPAVAPEGKLFIAIYNDTGSQAKRWRSLKKTYNQLPGPLKAPYAALVSTPGMLKGFVKSTLKGKPLEPFRSWSGYTKKRGMSRWHDIVDWVGGYPYEVATPDEIFDFYSEQGFRLSKLRVGGVGLGCNEFVFQRETPAADDTADA